MRYFVARFIGAQVFHSLASDPRPTAGLYNDLRLNKHLTGFNVGCFDVSLYSDLHAYCACISCSFERALT